MIKFKILFVLFLIFEITGCASKDAYHTDAGVPGNCKQSDNSGKASDECKKSYYQEHPGYDLAFAEFTERGNAFNDEHINDVLKKIRGYAEKEGIIVVTFVHGWKHNAKEGDDNLGEFKRTLATMAMDQSILRGRKLIGLYIGWRGESVSIRYVDTITFWDRKAVAEEVGKGGITQLLLELNLIDQLTQMNVLVVVGHSFGGAIVVSAVSEVLAERIVNRKQEGELAKVNGIGDAIIVLNPAVEANQALNLVEAAINEHYSQNQSPLLVSISSNSDLATHYAFPAGQTLGLLFTWHQHDLRRSYYRDRNSKEMGLVLKEEHLDSTTVGNFAPYLTHTLTSFTSEDQSLTLKLQPCEQAPDDCKPKGWTWLSGNPTMGPLPDNYPLYFIKTDKTVMTGHNDIFNPVIRSAMLSIIDDIVRRDVGKDASPSILNRPDYFNERFQHFHKLRKPGADRARKKLAVNIHRK